MTLVSATQLNALRTLAKRGMTSTGDIYRATKNTTSEGTDETFAKVGSSIGWLTDMRPVSVQDVAGVQAVVMVFSWRVPVGTDIRPFDHIVIGGETYYVSDTDDEGTIIPYITCTVRRMD